MISVEAVGFRYPRAPEPVFHGLSASFSAGGITAITGPNGCGKTTLVKLVTGVERPTAGHIAIDGERTEGLSLARIGRLAGCVLQNPSRQLFCTSVAEEVAFGLREMRLPEEEVEERARRALHAFGLLELSQQLPATLSHGQKQRLMLAAVLALRPPYLVLDEPTTGLDLVRRRELGERLKRLAHEDGCGIVLVSHERRFVSRYADEELALPGRGEQP